MEDLFPMDIQDLFLNNTNILGSKNIVFLEINQEAYLVKYPRYEAPYHFMLPCHNLLKLYVNITNKPTVNSNNGIAKLSSSR